MRQAASAAGGGTHGQNEHANSSSCPERSGGPAKLRRPPAISHCLSGGGSSLPAHLIRLLTRGAAYRFVRTLIPGRKRRLGLVAAPGKDGVGLRKVLRSVVSPEPISRVWPRILLAHR